jgi:hypothetical protein
VQYGIEEILLSVLNVLSQACHSSFLKERRMAANGGFWRSETLALKLHELVPSRCDKTRVDRIATSRRFKTSQWFLMSYIWSMILVKRLWCDFAILYLCAAGSRDYAGRCRR